MRIIRVVFDPHNDCRYYEWQSRTPHAQFTKMLDCCGFEEGCEAAGIPVESGQLCIDCCRACANSDGGCEHCVSEAVRPNHSGTSAPAWAAAKAIMDLDGMALVRRYLTAEYDLDAMCATVARIIDREFKLKPEDAPCQR